MDAGLILILMYHRVNDAQRPFSYDTFTQHFNYLVSNFSIISPGEAPQSKTSLCLTFDDAYYDFYHCVFPLLKAHKTKALLAISTKYIVKHTQLSPQQRLQVPYPQGMQNDIHIKDVPFCTWSELKEMAESGLVELASHTDSHPHMTDPEINFEKEVIESKQIIERETGFPVSSFVYPYGDFSRKIQQQIHAHYSFCFRIGSALNRSWKNKSGLFYRVDADHFWKNSRSIEEKDLHQFHRKYWWNRARFK